MFQLKDARYFLLLCFDHDPYFAKTATLLIPIHFDAQKQTRQKIRHTALLANPMAHEGTNQTVPKSDVTTGDPVNPNIPFLVPAQYETVPRQLSSPHVPLLYYRDEQEIEITNPIDEIQMVARLSRYLLCDPGLVVHPHPAPVPNDDDAQRPVILGRRVLQPRQHRGGLRAQERSHGQDRDQNLAGDSSASVCHSCS
jgi:hypothetical protein